MINSLSLAIRLLLLTHFLSLTACGVQTNPFLKQHPDIQVHCSNIKRIAVLPPNVMLYQVNLAEERKLLKDKVREASLILANEISAELSRRGFEANPISMKNEEKISSEALFQDAQIRHLYDMLYPELEKIKHLKYSKNVFECSLGNEAKSISSSFHSDALFFIIYQGQQRTAGSIAGEVAGKVLIAAVTAGMFIPEKNPSGYEWLGAALVDGTSGEVIWTNQTGERYEGFLPPDFDKESINKLIESLFKDFPK